MSSRILKTVERKLSALVLQRWSGLARTTADINLSSLRRLRTQARALRTQLNIFLFKAEGRLALPVGGSGAMQLPLYTDWSYRPELWSGPIAQCGAASVLNKSSIGSEGTLFHDCTVPELSYRQVRNVSDDDLAPFGLRLDVFRFDGSFLSLSIDTPQSACEGLSTRHIVRVAYDVELERPIQLLARLNVKHGPNLEQIVRTMPLSRDEAFVEFDLAYTKLNEKRVEKVWVDFIFEDPQMNKIILRDLTVSRRPRAEL